MDTMTSNNWKSQGSSIIFDQESLGPFIAAKAVISLRQFLSWRNKLPEDFPVEGSTLVISGLETVLETQTPKEAEDFLRSKIRPILIHLQTVWTSYGIVFGFTSHPNAFEETMMDQEVLFTTQGRSKVRLSEGLWDGSATLNMRRLARQGKNNEEIRIGYYVARIS